MWTGLTVRAPTRSLFSREQLIKNPIVTLAREGKNNHVTYTQNLFHNKVLFSMAEDITRVSSYLEKERFSDFSPPQASVTEGCAW